MKPPGKTFKAAQFLLLLLCGAALLLGPVQSFRHRMRMDQAVSIYICYPAFGMDIEEYEINFAEQQLYQYRSSYTGYVPRDAEGEHRGWQSAEPLSGEQLAALRRAGAAILSWREYYDDPSVSDGIQWKLIITFQDESTFRSAGSNAWPTGYSTTQEKFQAGGAGILRYGP